MSFRVTRRARWIIAASSLVASLALAAPSHAGSSKSLSAVFPLTHTGSGSCQITAIAYWSGYNASFVRFNYDYDNGTSTVAHLFSVNRSSNRQEDNFTVAEDASGANHDWVLTVGLYSGKGSGGSQVGKLLASTLEIRTASCILV